MKKHHEKGIQKSQEIAAYLNAGKAYAKAIRDSIESPTPDNTQKVMEASRVVLLKAAGLMSQETLAKLGDIQRQRMMKDE